jgi:hypothetical protein
VPYRTPSLVKLVACVTILVLPAFSAGPARAATTASRESSTSRALLDAARADAGLRVLEVDTRLERVARAQSERMAERGAIEHNGHLGQDVSATGVDWRWLGENVGVGPDAELIHDGFMASPSHRAVVVHTDANRIGVAAAIGKDGRVYITQVYAKILAPQHAPVAAAEAAPVQTTRVRAAAAQLLPDAHDASSADPNALIHGVVAQNVFEAMRGRPRGGLSAVGRRNG